MAIYRTIKGNTVKVKPSEVKATIMRANNWTADQYKKQYDIFKNKLRAFEAFEGTAKKQSAVELLYKQAKAKIRMGADYQPSIKMQRIEAFTSVSSGKASKLLENAMYRSRREATYSSATYKQFEGLIAKNAKAKEIYDNIKDPVARETALRDYANKLHAKLDDEGKTQENEAIPYGETFGSDEAIEFDYTAYM